MIWSKWEAKIVKCFLQKHTNNGTKLKLQPLTLFMHMLLFLGGIPVGIGS